MNVRITNVDLQHLLAASTQSGYRRLCLETGERQPAAIALYENFGFRRTAAFGPYVSDPTSICYELQLAAAPARD